MTIFKREEGDILEYFLRDIESLLSHLTVSKKMDVLTQVRQHILDFRAEKNLTMSEALKYFTDKVGLINFFLMKNGLTQITKKKRFGKLKFFLLVFLGITAAGTIALVIMIKSFLPIFDLNEETDTLTLFGKKIAFMVERSSYVSQLKRINRNSFPYEIEGDLSVKGVSKVNVTGDRVEMHIRSGKSKLVYKCYASSAVGDPVVITGDVLNLNIAGKSKCTIDVPRDVPFQGVFKKGKIYLENMGQSFNVVLNKGPVSWKEDEKSLFNLKVKIVRGVVSGDINRVQNLNAPYNVNIEIDKGDLNLH